MKLVFNNSCLSLWERVYDDVSSTRVDSFQMWGVYCIHHDY